ncbi:GCN5-related N-acetyltransferase, partial [Athelia psychrophila]
MDAYAVRHEIPSVQDYCYLRKATGLSGKAATAAAVGLPNSLFAVQIHGEPLCIGMARVIGDGGLWFQIVDVAVHPAHQGHGLGIRLMKEVEDWLVANVPQSGRVGLVAESKAQSLYEKFAFRDSAPGSVMMA